MTHRMSICLGFLVVCSGLATAQSYHEYRQALWVVPAFIQVGQADLLASQDRRPTWQALHFNPASLGRQPGQAASLVYDTRLDNRNSDFGAGPRGAPALPQAVTILSTAGRWSLAAGYAQHYNQRFLVLETTPSQPSGTGRTSYFDTRLEVLASEAAWTQQELPGLSKLSLGVGLGLSRFDIETNAHWTKRHVRQRFGKAWSIGLEARLRTARPLIVGLAWHKASAARLSFQPSPTIFSEGTIPPSAQAQVLIGIAPGSEFKLSLDRVFWGRTNRSFRHRTEAACSLAGQISGTRLALGVASSSALTSVSWPNGHYQAILLQAGIARPLGPVELSLNVQDGHWAKAAMWHQTSLSLGVRYAF